MYVITNATVETLKLSWKSIGWNNSRGINRQRGLSRFNQFHRPFLEREGNRETIAHEAFQITQPKANPPSYNWLPNTNEDEEPTSKPKLVRIYDSCGAFDAKFNTPTRSSYLFNIVHHSVMMNY